MRTPSVHQQRRAGLDDSFMTPMIDIVFQLLIFFVCASIGQIAESHLPAPLSAGSIAAAQAVETPPPLGEVSLKLRRVANKPGEFITVAEMNNRQFTDWPLLRATLKELASVAPEIPVLLDIEPAVPVADFIDVYDTCRAAGYLDIRFATGG